MHMTMIMIMIGHLLIELNKIPKKKGNIYFRIC